MHIKTRFFAEILLFDKHDQDCFLPLFLNENVLK